MADSNNDNSRPANDSLSRSVIYNKVTPWVLASLSMLYISILIFKYCSWKRRRNRTRRMRMNRQRVEKFWRKRAAHLEATSNSTLLQTPMQAMSHPAIPSFDSSATLVGIPSSNEEYRLDSPGDLSILNQIDEEKVTSLSHHLKHYNTMMESDNNEEKVSPATRIARWKWVEDMYSRLNGSHQQKKRRQLLWQWSVAMGYCRYSHGHHLNMIVKQLVEEKEQQSSVRRYLISEGSVSNINRITVP